MRTRKHDWFDSRGYKPKYGFQVLINGRWKHAAEDGKPCLFDTPEERDSKQAEFRKMATPSNAEVRGAAPHGTEQE